MFKFILSCIIALFVATAAMAGILPFEVNGTYQLKMGDQASVIEGAKIGTIHELTLDRTIPVDRFGIISVTPYVKGSVALEEFANDELYRDLEIGVDAQIYSSELVDVSVGVATQKISLPGNVDRTNGFGKLTVGF
ncbi:MAG: hypothetical protein HQ594_00885 [Candidatus Omnitrophica bacterium]|nr:hypothetical protein [Candidatus Omnitrophota bacterium]